VAASVIAPHLDPTAIRPSMHQPDWSIRSSARTVRGWKSGPMFFRLNSWALVVVLTAFVGGAAAVGTMLGRRLRSRAEAHHQSVGTVQATLLGLVGLVLAFGLTMAVGRYDNRRAILVQEANDIGTTFLRAQMLAEPARTTSLGLLRQYADIAVDLADQVPDSGHFDGDVERIGTLQRALWSTAGDAVAADPSGTAPRLYVEALNAMIDSHTDRVTSLRNRVPETVVFLEVFGSAIAIGVLALYLALLGRGLATSLVAAAVVLLILVISFDLDRPHRGLITVPDSALVAARDSMAEPPAAGP
jgi:hypothetical protein